jgi:hypothetical protein
VTNRLGIHGPLIRSEVHCKSLFIIPDFVLTLDRTHPNVMTTQSPALTADPAVLAQATLPPTTVASSGMDVDPPALGSMDCTGVKGVDTSEPHPGAVQPPPAVSSSLSDEVNIIDFHMDSSTAPATISPTETGDKADTTIPLPTAAATPFTQALPSTSPSSSRAPVVSPGTDVQSPFQPVTAATSSISPVVLPKMGAMSLSPPAAVAPPLSLPPPISPGMSAPPLVPPVTGHTTALVPASPDESTSTYPLSSRPDHLSLGTNPQPPMKKSTKMRPGTANTAR